MTINYTYNSETPRIMYGDACFLRICPECGKFVKADETAKWSENLAGYARFETNATCKKDGRVLMPFEGWF